jgi:hypothetical protein
MQGAWLRQYIGAGIPILSQKAKIVLKGESQQLFAAFCLLREISPIILALLGGNGNTLNKVPRQK